MKGSGESGEYPFQQFHGRELYGRGFVAYGASHRGRQRVDNQDHFLFLPLAERRILVAVADGLGGHNAGERASRAACDSVFRHAQQLSAPGTEKSLTTDWLASLVSRAHREVLALATGDASLAGMGTTMTLALVEPGNCLFAHVGDTRLYLFREGGLIQQTEDDVVSLDDGSPPAQALTKALGLEDPGLPPEPTSGTFGLLPGDRILLCSDGLSGCVPESLTAQILRSHLSVVGHVHQLLDAALAAGGPDNVSALLVDISQ